MPSVSGLEANNKQNNIVISSIVMEAATETNYNGAMSGEPSKDLTRLQNVILTSYL